jgi:two-component system response regulator CpxR
MDMNSILLIDDDIGLCELLNDYLTTEGFSVEIVHDGEAGAAQALAGDYSLVILDVMLPGINGFEVLRRLRAGSSTPILMLTARGDDVDRIVGLEMGADDYLPKPFNPRELVARIRAVQRRTATIPTTVAAPGESLSVGDITLEMGARTAHAGATQIELTSVEFSLLEVLMRQAGQVVSREELSRQALGRELNAYDRSIDVHVSSLRRKLGAFCEENDCIKTVRGIGYFYVRPSAAHQTIVAT